MSRHIHFTCKQKSTLKSFSLVLPVFQWGEAQNSNKRFVWEEMSSTKQTSLILGFGTPPKFYVPCLMFKKKYPWTQSHSSHLPSSRSNKINQNNYSTLQYTSAPKLQQNPIVFSLPFCSDDVLPFFCWLLRFVSAASNV